MSDSSDRYILNVLPFMDSEAAEDGQDLIVAATDESCG